MDSNAPYNTQPHPQLLEYIKSELAQGYSIDQIAITAKATGWSDEQIKQCIDWINNGNVNAQKATPAYTNPTGQSVYSAPTIKNKRLIGIFAAVFVVLAVIVAGALIASAFWPNSTSSLDLAIEKNLTTTSFQRTLSTKLNDRDGTLVAVCQCDLSQPSEPKANLQMRVTYPLGTSRDSLNQISIDSEAIVIGDTVWIRVNEPEIVLDETTRASFADKTVAGETSDDAIKTYYGITNVGTWRQFFADVEPSPSFEASLLPYIYGTVTVFGDFVMGSFGTETEQITASIKDTRVYNAEASSIAAESFNGVATEITEVKIDREAYLNLAQTLDDRLGLSERHTSQLQSNEFTGLVGHFNAWIDAQGTVYKIASLDNMTILEYKEYGATYEIQPPQTEFDDENFQNIQEDLRRFPDEDSP